MSAAVQLQPGVFGLYQARNRVLLPRYGRWAQKDPNASGMLHASLWHDGQAPMPELTAGPLADALGDGSSLFAFVRHSPFNVTDASGLMGTLGGSLAVSATQLGLRAGVAGGVFGAVLNHDRPGGVFLGFATGFVAGYTGGAAGGLLVGTSGGTLTGLIGAGSVGGGLAGFLDVFLLTGDHDLAARAGLFGMVGGGLTAGMSGHAAARAISQLDSVGNVWLKPPFERGIEIEGILGGNLPTGFRKIDKWTDDIVSSIKSINLNDDTYQNASALRSKIKGHINDLASFREGFKDGVLITENDYAIKEYILAVPFYSNSQQTLVLNEMAAYAQSKGIAFTLRTIP